MYKIALLVAFIGAASAGVVGPAVGYAGYAAPLARAYAPAPVAYAQPIAKVAVAARAEPYDPHPQYNYGYSVADGLTGDQKNQQESRDGDVVQGQYSLVQPDGVIRTVTYTADPVQGFNAVVSYSGAPAVHQKVAVATPVAVRAAPVAYAQPIARAIAPVVQQYASYAPVQQYAARPVVAAYAQPIARAYAHAPVARVAGPVGYAHGGAVVSTNFGSPYAQFAY